MKARAKPKLQATKLSPAQARAVAGRLSQWFISAQRPMPWRKTRDPYRIWLSEIMLQQTRVETVIPYYEKFLDSFPRVEELARAPLEKVLSLWSGLGYYARARSLHKAAKVVAKEFKGKFPQTAEKLRELPGVGPYTAGAIASIAFDEPAPAVDGNVVRVLSRLLAWAADTADPVARAAAEPLVAQILSHGRPRILTQALMELGATLCLPASPVCEECPLARSCSAKKTKAVESYPIPKARKKPKVVRLVALALLDSKGRVLLQKRAEEGLFGGLWEIPYAEQNGAASEAALAARLARASGGTKPSKVGKTTHVLTHRRMETALYKTEAKRASRAKKNARWIDPKDPGALPLSTFQRKLLGLLAD